jgi:hypothetical protein
VQTYATSLVVVGDGGSDFATAAADVRVLDCPRQGTAIAIGDRCTLLFKATSRYEYDFVPGGWCSVSVDGTNRFLHVTDAALSFGGSGSIDVQVGGAERISTGGTTHTIVRASGSRVSRVQSDECSALFEATTASP